MLSNDKRMHTSRIHTKLATQHTFQARRVQHGSRTDHTMSRQSREFPCGIGKNIDRIRYDQKDSLDVSCRNLTHDLTEYLDIFVYKIESRLLRTLIAARCHNDDRTVCNIIIISGMNFDRHGKRHTVHDIHCLALRLLAVHIQEDHLRKQSALHDRKCCCCSYIPTTDNCYFSIIHVSNHTFLRSVQKHFNHFELFRMVSIPINRHFMTAVYGK